MNDKKMMDNKQKRLGSKKRRDSTQPYLPCGEKWIISVDIGLIVAQIGDLDMWISKEKEGWIYI